MNQKRVLLVLLSLVLAAGLAVASVAFASPDPGLRFAQSQARPDEVAPTADDASLNLALTIDTNLLQEVDLEASGGFLPDALGQQRTRISEGGAARLIWDGHAAGFDAAGLGGIDLTGSGLRDQLRLSVAAIADPVTARFTVYSDAGSASTVELRLTAVGDVRIPFGSFTAVSGAGADFGNVGALTLDLTGDVAGLQLSALAADSPLTATHTQEALADDVVAHAITLANHSGRDLDAFTFHAPALGRGGQLVAGSVAASQGRALAGAEAAVALDGLANGESVTLAYREMRLLATVPATLILQNGDTPTGSNGLPVDAVNNPVTSGLGEPAFSGDFDAGTNDDEFVWHGAGIAMSSSGVMTDFSSIESNIGVGDSGKFIASPILSAGSLDGVWTHNGALLYEQDPAPGVPGQYVSFASRPFMIPNGTAYFVGGYTATPGGTTADRVLWEATDTITPVITPLIQGGDVISGLVVSTNGIDFDYFVSDNGAHMMAVLDMDTGSTLDDFFVYLDGNLIIQEGAPISATENWDNFDIVQINDIGNYIIAGDTDGAATSDEFIAYNGTILIREGDTIDGVTLTDSAFVRNASINNLNQAVYTWGYAGGGTEAMFHACDAANLANARLVLMTGDQVDLDGNGSPDATITDFNAVQGSQYFTFAEDGRIYTEVDLDYGAGAVEAVIGVDAPSCTLGLSFAKTVGTDPGVCAAGSSLDILAGTDVYYCYEVMNTGAVTMTLHDLADDQLGAILSGFAYDLGPGASVFVTQTANITQTTTNTAIWTAYNPGPTDVVSATAAATVNVVPPTIALNKTVGTDPSACASSSSIVTGPNTDVTYCYEVTNAGLITLTLHDLVDTELGTILSGLAYDLGPGASVFVTQTANITQTTVNTATWTAYNAGPTDVATASASATVVVVPTAPLTCNGPTVGFDLGIPGGWNVVNNAPGNPVVWTNVAGSGEAGNYATGSGDAASASSDLQGGGSGLYDTELWTSPIDLSGVSQATFSYWANYGNFAFIDFLDLDVSTDGGATWTNLLRWNEDHHPNGLRNAPGEFVSIDLSAYTGQSNVILRWHYYDPAGPATSQDWYAQVDDVSLSCLSGTLGVSLNKTVGTDPSVCATTDTITVKGGTDAYYCYEVTNTGTVTVTMHDLDDDKLGNVFSSVAYDLAPGASIDTVALGLTISATINTTTTNTATWTGYVGTYTAVATDTATVNTTVPAAQLDTTSISETLSVGGMTDVIMTLDNTGSDDLSWTLVEEAAARGASRDIGTAWETMAPLPSARVFSAVVADANGYVYAIGGTSDAGALTPTDTVFRYDTATNTWATMAAMPAALDSIDGIVIKDKIYIPGGDLDNNTYVYDIATDSWSTIATNNGFTGRAQYQVVAIGDDLYVLGGISVGASTTEVWILDTTTGTWSAGVPMQRSRTSFSAAAIDGQIYVAGGVAFPGFAPDMTAEKFDGSAWSFIASVPDGGGAYTRWSYNADGHGADGLWLAAGRRDAGWAVLNHAGYYNPETDTWTDSPTVPTLNQGRVYMEGAVASDGFFYVIGGRDSAGAIVYDTNERLMVGAPVGPCDPTDLPWLNATPTSGVVAAGGSEQITVSLDASGLATGSYAGALCLTTNDPVNPTIRVPVSLEVVEPANLQVAHLAPFATGAGTAVTITLNSTVALTNVVYGDSTPYLSVPAGTTLVEVWPAGSMSPAISATVDLMPGMDYTAIAIGDGVNQPLELLALADDNSAPAAGSFKLRLGHLAPFASGPATADIRLQDGTPVLTNVNFSDVSGYLALPAGEYDLKITTPGGGDTLIDPLPVTFAAGDIVSVFAVGDGTNEPTGAYALPAGASGYFLPIQTGYTLYLPVVFRMP